jgi:transglutaminase-like putative cysteine protease
MPAALFHEFLITVKGALKIAVYAGIFITTCIPVLCNQGYLPGYPAAAIPDSLKTGANAVVREDSSVFTYASAQRTHLFVHRVVTVLNKNGDDHGAFLQSYDKLRKITSFKGSIYDAGGRLVRKFNISDADDYSGSAGYDQFDDFRFKNYEPLQSQYPYSVEYEYVVEFSGSLFFPKWDAFDDYGVSVENTVLIVNVPKGYALRHKAFNLNEEPAVQYIENRKQYVFKAQNIRALDQEPYADNIRNHVQTVFTAPSVFFYDGSEGTMDTWDSFAGWIRQLNAGRDILPEERVAEINELVKHAKDEREKIQRLYHYMQGRTRYFSIQLGIGGYQPMDAKTVDEVGYSDCKGLTNYMKALLKAVGIESHYTLVASGADFPRLVADFPSLQFNHAMLCVPLRQDTIWLECTSQINPFGFLGDFTSDRQVLIIKDDGAALARTPVYEMEDNFQTTHARIAIAPDGNAEATATRAFGGLQYDDWQGQLLLSPADLKTWLFNYVKIPNFAVKSCDFKEGAKDMPASELNVSMALSSYGSLSGKRMFVPMNLLNRSTYVPGKIKKRWSNIEKKVPYVDTDSIVFTYPREMLIEYIPEKTVIDSPFGSYVSVITTADSTITYVRKVNMYKGVFPGSAYDELIKFYRDISVADKCQAILIKKDG